MNTVKCDYCDNDAVDSSIDPFDAEIYEDFTEKHFVCRNVECVKKFGEALDNSAMEI